MKFLITYCGKKVLAILFITSMLTLLLDLLSIAMIFPFLKLFIEPDVIMTNRYVRPIYDHFRFASTGQFIMVSGISLIAIYLLKLVFKTVLARVKFDYTNRITFQLATDLFRGLLNARYSLFTKESTSEMVGVVNAHTIHSMICLDSWINILNEVAFLVVVIAIFLVLGPVLTLAIFGTFAVIGFVLYIGLVKRIDRYGKVHSRLNMLVYKFAFAVANSVKDIKIMGLEGKYITRFSNIWNEYSSNDSKAKTAKGIPRDFSETLVFSGMIGVCLYILATHQNLTEIIPVLGVVAVSAMRILPSFNKIISNYNEYKYYRNSLVVVEELYHKLRTNRQRVELVNMPFTTAISMRDIGFHYDDKSVLTSVSIDIPKGSSVAFVGLSGAGKSTLLDILAGLQQVSQGEFYLDGKRFDPFNTNALRSRIGYVPQNVNLIDESVAYNISFDEQYDRAQMDKVVQMARLTPYIAELPLGIDTIIGESGVRVSGGQRQRIGIARALYHDPEILIFDEATSALDNITERELMDEINALSRTKTLIIVAHRLTTVEKCDCIYLLDQGRVLASGTHAELLTHSEAYQNMYHKQQR